MNLKNMEVITLILGALLVGLVVVFLSPLLYDKAKQLYVDYTAKAEPIINIIKVQKIDFSESYIGGENFFHTVDGKGQLIHLSPDFSEELVKKNLTGGFFNIPDDCNKCVSYVFHLKNTNNKIIKNITLEFKVRGKIFEPKIRLVSPEKEKQLQYIFKNSLYKVNISYLFAMETISFGILLSEPGDLVEAACDIKDGNCTINHLGLFYRDIIMNTKKNFLNYNGKEYFLPKINNLSDNKNYQLINGVWTEYK